MMEKGSVPGIPQHVPMDLKVQKIVEHEEVRLERELLNKKQPLFTGASVAADSPPPFLDKTSMKDLEVHFEVDPIDEYAVQQTHVINDANFQPASLESLRTLEKDVEELKCGLSLEKKKEKEKEKYLEVKLSEFQFETVRRFGALGAGLEELNTAFRQF